MTGRLRRADLVHTVHVLHGAGLLLRPAAAARAGGAAPGGGTIAVARVLGARHLVQGLAGLARPRWAPLGAAVDGLHALSMVGVAALDRAHRRGALTSASVAVVFAAGGWWAARSRTG